MYQRFGVMYPLPAMGNVRWKPDTGNRSLLFEEEVDVDRPLPYISYGESDFDKAELR